MALSHGKETTVSYTDSRRQETYPRLEASQEGYYQLAVRSEVGLRLPLTTGAPG